MEMERESGETALLVGEGESLRVPVSRDNAKAIREHLLANATGLRRS